MNQITVKKEILLNLGNFSNIKIGVEITSDESKIEDLWGVCNEEIQEQELYERGLRLPKKESVNKPF